MSAELLVFDLDDTLYPESTFVRSGFKAVDKWLCKAAKQVGFADIALQLFERGVRGNIFNLALIEMGMKDNVDLVQQMVNVYRTHIPIVSLHSDAEWALSFFENMTLGIITDGYIDVQKNKVKALNLSSYVKHIIYTDFYGRKHWKPSPKSYEEMMNVSGFPAESCVYVGDNPTKDFVAAKRLGWSTIQICRLHGEYGNITVKQELQADHVISSLHDLDSLL